MLVLPPQSRLKELFDYDPSSGLMFHKIGRGRSVQGQQAGSRPSFQKNGRRRKLEIIVDGKIYIMSRIIWKWVTGLDPEAEIDHRDTNCHNNAWENLRDATRGQNNTNKAPNRGQIHKGIRQMASGRWQARICFNSSVKHLGMFDTCEDARDAWIAASLKHHGEFHRV